MQKAPSKTMDNDIKELEKKFDKLEPKETAKSANIINTAKQHLSRGSGSAVNKYKSQAKGNSPTPQEKKTDSNITGTNSLIRSVIATAAAPIAYDTASFQEVMNQAKKDGVDDKQKAGNAASTNPKTLKEKSASSTALRVGPFAAIRENEMKRKKKASLDLNPNEED